MRIIRTLTIAMIFTIACPLSWVAAWVYGSWIPFALSVVLPTYGVIYWGLFELMGNGVVQFMLSWILAFIGAGSTVAAVRHLHNQNRRKEEYIETSKKPLSELERMCV